MQELWVCLQGKHTASWYLLSLSSSDSCVLLLFFLVCFFVSTSMHYINKLHQNRLSLCFCCNMLFQQKHLIPVQTLWVRWGDSSICLHRRQQPQDGEKDESERWWMEVKGRTINKHEHPMAERLRAPARGRPGAARTARVRDDCCVRSVVMNLLITQHALWHVLWESTQ